MDLIVRDIQFLYIEERTFKMVYHLGCENNHTTEIEGDSHMISSTESAENRIVEYLVQQSESRYDETTRD